MNYLFINYKIIAIATTALFIAVLSAYVQHRLDQQVKQDALAVQSAQLSAQCVKAQQTTNEVSHDYQTQLSSLRDELDAAKRVQPHACIPVHTSKTTSGHSATAKDARFHQKDAGLDSNDLLDFAGDAEQVGRQLDACQAFLGRVY